MKLLKGKNVEKAKKFGLLTLAGLLISSGANGGILNSVISSADSGTSSEITNLGELIEDQDKGSDGIISIFPSDLNGMSYEEQIEKLMYAIENSDVCLQLTGLEFNESIDYSSLFENPKDFNRIPISVPFYHLGDEKYELFGLDKYEDTQMLICLTDHPKGAKFYTNIVVITPETWKEFEENVLECAITSKEDSKKFYESVNANYINNYVPFSSARAMVYYYMKIKTEDKKAIEKYVAHNAKTFADAMGEEYYCFGDENEYGAANVEGKIYLFDAETFGMSKSDFEKKYPNVKVPSEIEVRIALTYSPMT